MSVAERDPHTGHMTTGHEWNGIKELNTPVPKLVWYFLAAAVVFSVGYWLLMPAWPVGVTYTRGLLGIDQRTTVAESLRQAAIDRAAWADQIEAMDLEDVQADASLMRVVRETGPALFEDNCAACHGVDARGGNGYPSLTDAAWLWGGDPETVAETIRVGINAAHDETRVSQMPGFGRDQMLDRAAVLNVVAFVQSLSDQTIAAGQQADAVTAGRQVFAENCAACHGEDGKGSIELGAPDLTDGFWIYGSDRQSVYASVFGGRQGHMPQWDDRLTPLDLKILALYVLDLGPAQK
jgi:cytochrome c oxidase cbb3-type subunit III